MAEAAMKTIPLGQGQGETGFGITPTNWNKGYATESPAACCTPGSKPLASIVLPLNAPRKKGVYTGDAETRGGPGRVVTRALLRGRSVLVECDLRAAVARI